MENGRYKFEKYRDKSLPIYSSVQSGKSRLVQPHFHGDIEFLWVSGGSVRVRVGFETLECSEGDVVFIAPTVVHGVESLTADAEIHGLVFHPKMLLPTFDFKGSTSNHRVFKGGDSVYRELSEVLCSAVRLYGGEGQGYKLKMTAFCMQLASILFEVGMFKETATAKFNRVKPALEYIEAHFSVSISVKLLSRLVGLCQDRFIRVFKEETGRTPNAYITEFRLHEAMRLLSEGELSVSEVAERTGFCDASYFSRIFKQHLGVNPKNYKSDG